MKIDKIEKIDKKINKKKKAPVRRRHRAKAEIKRLEKKAEDLANAHGYEVLDDGFIKRITDGVDINPVDVLNQVKAIREVLKLREDVPDWMRRSLGDQENAVVANRLITTFSGMPKRFGVVLLGMSSKEIEKTSEKMINDAFETFHRYINKCGKA